ncbi:MAG: hypothetical protein QOJ42_7200 [Acidobacteriaceae bacterium]|jgi:hypothetical protein|nr:hypothetical protein [Acidobacteriaceae bacterium]
MLRVEAASLGSQEQTLKAAVDRADGHFVSTDRCCQGVRS